METRPASAQHAEATFEDTGSGSSHSLCANIPYIDESDKEDTRDESDKGDTRDESDKEDTRDESDEENTLDSSTTSGSISSSSTQTDSGGGQTEENRERDERDGFDPNARLTEPLQTDVNTARDVIPEHRVFSGFDMIVCVLSIGLYFLDIGSDTEMAVRYFTDGKMLNGGLTLAFIGVGYTVVFIFGIMHYRHNDIEDYMRHCTFTNWQICWIVLLFLGASPVALSLEYLYYGWKFRKSRHRIAPSDVTEGNHGENVRVLQSIHVTGAGRTNALMRLLEGFLEAAPQLCFQLYVVFKEKPQDDTVSGIIRAVTVLSSWLSLAMCTTTYYRYRRLDDSTDVSKSGQLVYFLWRACETGGRVMCVALFASVLWTWTFLVLGVHYVVMITWHIYATRAGRPKGNDILFGIAFGYVMIFGLSSCSKGLLHTRYMYLLYYMIFYTENVFMFLMWFWITPDNTAWFYVPAIVTVVVFFFLQVRLQIVYYKKFHPTAEQIEWWVPWDWEEVRKSLCEWY